MQNPCNPLSHCPPPENDQFRASVCRAGCGSFPTRKSYPCPAAPLVKFLSTRPSLPKCFPRKLAKIFMQAVSLPNINVGEDDTNFLFTRHLWWPADPCGSRVQSGKCGYDADANPA